MGARPSVTFRCSRICSTSARSSAAHSEISSALVSLAQTGLTLAGVVWLLKIVIVAIINSDGLRKTLFVGDGVTAGAGADWLGVVGVTPCWADPAFVWPGPNRLSTRSLTHFAHLSSFLENLIAVVEYLYW